MNFLKKHFKVLVLGMGVILAISSVCLEARYGRRYGYGRRGWRGAGWRGGWRGGYYGNPYPYYGYPYAGVQAGPVVIGF